MSVLATAWSGLATALSPAVPWWLNRRVRRGKEDAARLPERHGRSALPRPAGRLLWLHAASVGESVSALPLLEAVAARAPGLALLVTTGTLTSARLVGPRLPPGAIHQFLPLDVPHFVARFLDHWRPDAGVFVESELWPNLIRAAGARGVPLALVNARMSVRSHARWRRAPGLARDVLSRFRLVLAQSGRDAGRFAELGARRVEAPGNLKFAAPPLPADPAALDALRASIGARPAWVAASTHPGEEEQILRAHAALLPGHPALLSIVVPRHPERGAALAAALPGATRRALGQKPGHGLHLADTLGELGLFYRLDAPVFTGGSLVPHGGQNPLEPARLGRPVAFGPHTQNFAEATAALLEAGGAARVTDAAALAQWVDAMLRDPDRRAAMGAAGAAAAGRYAGLPDLIAESLLELLPAAMITPG